MIQEQTLAHIETLTTSEKFCIVAEGFAKIAWNFWPVILLAIIVFSYLAWDEAKPKTANTKRH